MDPIPDDLAAQIQTLLRERRTHGLALCAFDADGALFGGGIGWADLSRCEPVTTSTVFRVASISKLVTTAVVLAAVDAGELDLDSPVNRHLPSGLQIRDAHGQLASSTVRSLLSHTSGLPAGTRGAAIGNPVLSYLTNQGRVRQLSDAITGLLLTHEPGERIVYSNPAFNVAGYLAAVATGRPFEAAARERILGPLGMVDSEFTSSRRGPGVATPYGSILPPGVGTAPADGLRLVATPMGGLTASASDLVRFGQFVLRRGDWGGRQLLSSQLLDAATSIEARNHPALDQAYGLGFKVRRWRGRTTIGHDGNMPGVATQLLLSPRDRVGVVVLTNGYALGVPHQVADLALARILDSSPAPAPEASPEQRAAAAAIGRRVEGTYRFFDRQLPGVVGQVGTAITRIRLIHEVEGRLRLDGNPGSDGPVWLLPEAVPGRYRVASAVDDGGSAVIEERTDGVHLWLGTTTRLRRRQRS